MSHPGVPGVYAFKYNRFEGKIFLIHHVTPHIRIYSDHLKSWPTETTSATNGCHWMNTTCGSVTKNKGFKETMEREKQMQGI